MSSPQRSNESRGTSSRNLREQVVHGPLEERVVLQDLEDADEQQVRHLFHRLNQFSVGIPPLRKRTEAVLPWLP